MMDVGLKAWAELVQRIYPELPILRDRSRWLAGQFDRPSVFIETDLVSDKTHTPRADRIIEDVGLVFHYDIDRSRGRNPRNLSPWTYLPSFCTFVSSGSAWLRSASAL